MALLLKLFEMHTHRQVILRTIWTSTALSAISVVLATLIWLYLFPNSASAFMVEIRIVTIILSLLLAVPVLYCLFYMSLMISRKNDELFQLANLDPLTGIYNRRALAERFAFLARKARRTQESGIFLVIDVDHFKMINDQCGHEIGDAVLIHLATTLRKIAGSNSCFARLGGEEFAVARFDLTDKTALEFAEEIRVTIQNSPLKIATDEITFTVSIGYCSVGAGQTLNTAMRNADAALYSAKRTGRNRTVCFDSAGITLAPKAEDLLQTSEKTSSNQSASNNWANSPAISSKA